MTIGGASAGAGTFTDMTSGNIKVGVTGDNEIDTSSLNLIIDSAGGTINIDDNLTVAGVSTFSSNVYLQKADAANLYVGSTNAGGAAIYLDGDSNGDWTGSDYSLIRHDSDGNLVLTANSPGAANCYIMLGGDGDYGAMFKEGAESLLRWDNSTKIQTGPAGVIITGVSTADGFRVGDNEYISVGAGGTGDMLIYHNGVDSYINDVGTGSLKLVTAASGVIVIEEADANLAIFTADSGVQLNDGANNARLNTNTDGVDISGTGSIKVPVGTTAQRNGSPADGDIRYNSTLNSYEGYGNSAWGGLGGGTEVDNTIATTTATGISTFAKADYRSAYFRLQITQGSAYQVGRYLLIHDGTTATLIEESAIATGSMLGSVTAAVVSSNVIISINMASSSSATITHIIDKITV